MKTAVLFSLVFLVLAIAFLNPASAAATNRCDCVGIVAQHVDDYADYLMDMAPVDIPQEVLEATPEEIGQFVCDHAPPAVLEYAAALLNC